jgi:hypothetical protein
MTSTVPVPGSPTAATATAARGGVAEFAGPVLLAALAAGLLGQGGYAGRPRLVLAVLVGAAGLLTLPLWRGPAGDAWRRRPLRAVPVAAGLLAGWALIDGALHGDPIAGAGPALLATGCAVAVCAGRRLSDAGEDVLVGGLVAVGVVIAAAGWAGVALRLHPWAWQAQGLWRASSTLSYPNATAAVLAPLALLVLARLTTRRSVLLDLAAAGLLTGLAATGSRAGLLAAAAGLTVLAAMRGGRPMARAAAGPVLGALVGTAGLLPSMPTGSPPRPALAAIALVAGLAAAAAVRRLPARIIAAVLAGTVAAVAGAVAAVGSAGGLRGIAAARATLASPDRVDAWRAAFRLLAAAPLVGTGPGNARLHWVSADGVAGTMPYVHNEYLQVATELGAVGAALLAGLLLAAAWMLRTAPRTAAGTAASTAPRTAAGTAPRAAASTAPRTAAGIAASTAAGEAGALRAGVAAAAAAFAVHSALDFGWHLPAIPLLMAALIGVAARPRLSAESSPADPVPSDGTPDPLLAEPLPPDPIPTRKGSS